jgi:tetratricopeptide (TPR) repeat protein
VLSIIRPNLALVFTELDRNDEAAAILADDASDRFGRVLYNSGGWLSSLCAYSEVCATLGAVGPARDLADLIAPYADHIVCAGQFSSGSAHRYLGLLAATVGDYEDADRHFAEALTVNERIGSLIWAARSRVDWARALLARNGLDDSRHARMLAEAARHTAAERGCRRLERSADELLAELERRGGRV